MKTAAVYIRVSTEEQTEYSPDAQLKEAVKYAEAHDMTLCKEHIYIDEGISGKSTRNRSAFNRMIGTAKMKPKPFDVLLLWKFSRFARNREDSIVYKSLLRRQLGIEVISITENIGDDKLAVLMEAFIEAMDEYYSINLAEEVKKGMTEKAMRGEFQTAPPLGYSKLPGMPLAVIEEEAKYVQYIFDWYCSGLGFFAIANRLNDMGFHTKRGKRIESRAVEYILNNPVYKGYVRWTPTGKTVGKRIYNSEDTLIVKSGHNPIISEELFDTVQKRLALGRHTRRQNCRPPEIAKHYLSGLLKCGSCGSALAYSKSNEGFQCVGYTHGTCGASHYIKASKIERAVLSAMSQVDTLEFFFRTQDCSNHLLKNMELIQGEKQEIRRKLHRARQAFLAGVDTLEEYESGKLKLLKELRQKDNDLAALESRGVPTMVENRKAPASLENREAPASLENGEDPEKFANREIPANQVPQQRPSIHWVLESTLPVSIKNRALREIVEKIVFSRERNSVTVFLYYD